MCVCVCVCVFPVNAMALSHLYMFWEFIVERMVNFAQVTCQVHSVLSVSCDGGESEWESNMHYRVCVFISPKTSFPKAC